MLLLLQRTVDRGRKWAGLPAACNQAAEGAPAAGKAEGGGGERIMTKRSYVSPQLPVRMVEVAAAAAVVRGTAVEAGRVPAAAAAAVTVPQGGGAGRTASEGRSERRASG